ncbi:ABC transporter permease [Terrilactibacillus laevilacticus]|uniref:ABC transporter permease n=1 Tax=Terrilactibacillus laevilacticus TaxID=1380157 RepID=UPI001147625A|nr:ABC transporter permease subunit [Terrilactibacillus laevilacticus]
MRGFVAFNYLILPITLFYFVIRHMHHVMDLFQDPSFVSALWNTVLISFIVAMINLIVGNLVGYFLAENHHWIWDLLLQLPLLVPLLIVAVAAQYGLLLLNMADSLIGVILVQLLPTLPYAIRIARNRFSELDHDIPKYIRLMGGGRWVMLTSVYLPLLQKSNETIVLLTIVISISQYATTSIVGGGIVPTMATLLFPFFTSTDIGLAATAVLITVLLSMIMVWSFRLVYSGFVWIVLRRF